MAGRTAIDPWSISVEDFPLRGSTSDKLKFALRYASRAPSTHNTQPWNFRLVGDAIELHSDRRRLLSIVDPAGRELIISCGAALFFLRVALKRFGFRAEVEFETGAQTLLAVVRIAGDHDATVDERAMFDAIARRQTNRHEFESRPVPDAHIDRLTQSAVGEGAWLEPVSDEPRKRALAGLVADANRIQFADNAFRGELASWIRDEESSDGMPTHGVPLSQVGEPLQTFFRAFDSGGKVAESERELALGADDSRAWLAVGQALASVLLTACVLNLSASFSISRSRFHPTGRLSRRQSGAAAIRSCCSAWAMGRLRARPRVALCRTSCSSSPRWPRGC